jgi:selenocysteine lyase/cysteine desulfurase
MSTPFEELKRSVHAALETYSNVHRGSGHHSMTSTRLYEHARAVVLAHLGLERRRHEVVFCSPRAAEVFLAQLEPGECRCVSSEDVGLPLGLRALAIARHALSRLSSFPAGGGTARLVGASWVVWAKAPGRFEAGTPSIVNVIALARALQLTRRHGEDCFRAARLPVASPSEILHHDAFEELSGRELLAALQASRIGLGLRVPTAAGTDLLVNLDNAASTPTFAPIWDAVWRTWQAEPEARQAVVREAAAVCADFLDAPAAEYEVLFTANTTEAINLVAESLGLEATDGHEPVVLNTILEHNSNELPWRGLPGVSQVRLGVDGEGFVDLAELKAELEAHNQEGRHGRKRIRLVTVSGASNVLGSCNDLEAICREAHRHGARALVDAAQLVAHRGVDVKRCGIDYLAFSAHKAYAPFGAGALVARKALLAFDRKRLERLRAWGEENAGGVAALAKAFLLLGRIGLEEIRKEEQALTSHALRGLARIPGVKVHGIADPESERFARRGGVIAFSLKGSMSYKVARELAERAGIGSRWGCHCAHMLIKRLAGLGPNVQQFQRLIVSLFPRIELPGVARASFGLGTTRDEIDTFLCVLGEIASEGSVKRKDLRRRIDAFVEAAVQRVYGEG